MVCGNSATISYHVLREIDNGELEEIYTCKECAPRYESIDYVVRRFDGTLFELEKWEWWKNAVPLDYEHEHIWSDFIDDELGTMTAEQRISYIQEHAVDVSQLPLNEFPLIEDFEIGLFGLVAKYKVRVGREEEMLCSSFPVYFYSPSRGRLVVLYDGSNKVCEPGYRVPRGVFLLPYYFVEQGISLLIFEDGMYVYMLCGNDMWDHDWNGYERWFKVEKKRYYEQWSRVIKESCIYHGSKRG